MKIDESIITSEPKPKNPLYLHYANVSCNDYGEIDEIVSSLAITLDNIDSFVVNRELTLEEKSTLRKYGFKITSVNYIPHFLVAPPKKADVKTYVERIHN